MALLPEHSALQHERAPRPLPLFLELLRRVGQEDPAKARAALDGLVRYERAARPAARPQKLELARLGGATLRDHGGDGPPALLIPSLINPPSILDLDADTSLADAIVRMKRRVLSLDWGPASERSGLDVAGHVAELLLPLLSKIGDRPALIGYCLGGTMAIAAANHCDCERVATLAAPWHFDLYPADARDGLLKLWQAAKGSAEAFGALPMEVLQAAFWSLDPERTVMKFAAFAGFDEGSAQAGRFVTLEDWANDGEPVPFAAARELIEDLYARNLSGSGQWRVADKPVTDRVSIPALHVTAGSDRIAPAATAPEGARVAIPGGHVGMVIGAARTRLHEALANFLCPQ